MARRAPKQYKVTVSYEEHTPEEEKILEEQITAAIYRAKMISLRVEQEKKEAANT